MSILLHKVDLLSNGKCSTINGAGGETRTPDVSYVRVYKTRPVATEALRQCKIGAQINSQSGPPMIFHVF